MTLAWTTRYWSSRRDAALVVPELGRIQFWQMPSAILQGGMSHPSRVESCFQSPAQKTPRVAGSLNA